MNAPTATELLKFVNVQMAAEALYRFSAIPTSANLLPGDTYSGAILAKDLTDGNRHASKFTATDAAKFATDWEVVEHKSNTTTGFSGTLFKNKTTNEYILSFRSTEFIDDAARDNQATNTLEVKQKGWAFGQIDDMEGWYKHLLDTNLIPGGTKISVTGYSLGGHLATAFNILRQQDGTQASRIDKVVTFNGAGVGTVTQGSLSGVMAYFHELRTTPAKIDEAITDAPLRTLVGTIRAKLADATWTVAQAKAEVDKLKTPEHPALSVQELMVWTALDRMQTVATEASDAPRLSSGSSDPSVPPNPATIPLSQIEQTQFNYQMAVLLAGQKTQSVGLVDGLIQTFTGGQLAANPMANQYDVQGAPLPSAVSNSQIHYGSPVKTFIEDQPLKRGNYVSEALVRSLSYLDIKLLTNNYSVNDFGDTHSLVLLQDSLAVQNALLQLLPDNQRAAAADLINTVLIEASNLMARSNSDQGKAEGDVLENTVNALADLILGPDRPTEQKLKGSPEGNTWASTADPAVGYSGRDKLYAVLQSITDSAAYKAQGTSGSLRLCSHTNHACPWSTTRARRVATKSIANHSTFIGAKCRIGIQRLAKSQS